MYAPAPGTPQAPATPHAADGTAPPAAAAAVAAHTRAGRLLITSTQPALNMLLLISVLRASVWASNLKVSRACYGANGLFKRFNFQVSLVSTWV